MDLPPAYFQRRAADPLAFELPNGFWGTRTNLPPVREPALVPQPTHRVFEGTLRFPVILALYWKRMTPSV